jgi:hypothetical protein
MIPVMRKVVVLTGIPMWAKWWICLYLIASPCTVYAQSNSPDAVKTTPPIAFFIAAGELGAALDTYSQTTGLAVIIDSRHASVSSAGVIGHYSPRDALLQLLHGTGLVARYTDANAIAIVDIAEDGRKTDGQADAGVKDMGGASDSTQTYMAYLVKVQSAIRDALCRSAQARPGNYRLALQLSLDGQGKVVRPRFLDTTGITERDTAIMQVLRAVDVGQAPPPLMPQPVAILLLPDSVTMNTTCAAPVGGRVYVPTENKR